MSRCAWNPRKTNEFCMSVTSLFVCSCRLWWDRSLFEVFCVRRSDWSFRMNVEIIAMSCRCPEVGLGIPNRCDWNVLIRPLLRLVCVCSESFRCSFGCWLGCPEVELGSWSMHPNPTSGHRVCSESFRCSYGRWVRVSRGRIRNSESSWFERPYPTSSSSGPG